MGRCDVRRPEEIAFLEADANRFLERRSRDADHAAARPRATVCGPSQAPTLALEGTADGVEEFFGCFGRAAPQLLARGGVASGHVPARRQLEDALALNAQSSGVERFRLADAPE
ncbi:MAG: hypothetical protein ACYS19_00450 [Planctomycetota bacterium]